jgi:geranylgeranyl reductase family protein
VTEAYDVIVVGAGPAGASAAHDLARAGLRVLMLEKEKLPRYKTCGGGLPGRVAEALGFDFSPTVEQPISRGQTTWRSAAPVVSDFGQTAGWCVMRAAFDHYLTQQAVNAGARCLDGTPVRRVEPHAGHVRVETKNESFGAQLLVGADGVNSLVARSVGLMATRRLAVALEAEIEVSPEAREAWQGALHLDFGSAPWGYAWVFPKAHHLSVGVATFQDRRKVNLRRYLDRFLARQPLLREHQVKLLRGQHIPLGNRGQVLHRWPVLLAGDAGGFADPFLGEGIYYAIRSGRLAASVIVEALRAGETDLSPYTLRAQAELGPHLRAADRLAQVFYRAPWLSYQLFRRSPSLQDLVIRAFTGRLSYRQAARRAVRQGGQLLAEFAGFRSS